MEKPHHSRVAIGGLTQPITAAPSRVIPWNAGLCFATAETYGDGTSAVRWPINGFAEAFSDRAADFVADI
jgi:hypothetical protein